MGSTPLHVQAAVEGIVDEAVVRRLFAEVGIVSFSVFPANGKRRLQQRLDGYNRAAEQSPWVVLVDLNHSAACAAELCRH